MKREIFSVVIEYPREVGIGSVVTFEDKHIKITKLTKFEPVTERAFLISGHGEVINPYRG